MSKSEYKEIGSVREIWRYPVKSMAGEHLECSKLGWQGLAGDRRFSFNRVGNRSGLPFLSAREFHGLVRYGAGYSNPDDVDHSPVLVTGPDGEKHDLYSETLRAQLETCSACRLEVIRLWRGAFDAMPVSLITSTSIEAAGKMVGASLEVHRFRPNLVIEALDERSYPEDRWIGGLIVIGADNDAARIRINRKDIRCVIVDINPTSGERDQNLLAEIAKTRKNCLGIYGSTERPGCIKRGDIVRIGEA